MFPPFQWQLFSFNHFLFEFWWHPPPFSKSFYFGKELLPNLATVLTDLTAKRLTRREIFQDALGRLPSESSSQNKGVEQNA